ncbi:MAG: LpxI family protein, partial [Pseudomonadota bacterium]|nr:LpxI family protein [Pseudomonadota bacterium]
MAQTPLPILGILAGGGRLPEKLIEACQAGGRQYFVLAFEGAADPASFSGLPHAVVRLGAVGEALDHLKRAGVQEIVMAGHMRRPSFTSLRPDMVGAKLLARLGTAIFSGDDALLKAVIRFLEDEGFRVIGSDEVLRGVLAPAGVLGKVVPDAQ